MWNYNLYSENKIKDKDEKIKSKNKNKSKKGNKNTSCLNSQARAEGVKMFGARSIKKQEWSLSVCQPILVLRPCTEVQ